MRAVDQLKRRKLEELRILVVYPLNTWGQRTLAVDGCPDLIEVRLLDSIAIHHPMRNLAVFQELMGLGYVT